MNGWKHFLIISLLITLFPPLTFPSPVVRAGLAEGEEVQSKKEAPQNEGVNPATDPGRCDSKPSGVTNPLTKDEVTVSEMKRIEERWGVKIIAIRLSANGYMLDFRFHVIDPEKANPLIGRHAKPYIIDEASGVRFSVPNMPKVGSLRAKGNKPDRDYFILFSNPNGMVKRGSKVRVIADDFKVEHLIVE